MQQQDPPTTSAQIQEEDKTNEAANTEDDQEDEATFETNWTESVEKFDDLNLKEDVLRGIYGYGFERPSPIQQKGILPVILGKDTIAQAQSGTGKTGTFTIGILQVIDTMSDKCQGLVVAPTRELATQTAQVISSIGEYSQVKVHALVGGTAVRDDIQTLKSGVQVIVATPGRLHDMMKKGFLKTDHMKIFVLDEADEMLSRGFKDQIQQIFKFLPQDI